MRHPWFQAWYDGWCRDVALHCGQLSPVGTQTGIVCQAHFDQLNYVSQKFRPRPQTEGGET